VVVSSIFIVVLTTDSEIMKVYGNNITGEGNEFNQGLASEDNLNNQSIDKDGTREAFDGDSISQRKQRISGDYDYNITSRKVRKRHSGFSTNMDFELSPRRKRKSRKRRNDGDHYL
jgi:hypothetical protein